jgi:hypothetical protein
MEHAYDVDRQEVEPIVGGRTVPNVPRLDVGDEPTFPNADWTPVELARAERNFPRHYRPAFESGPVHRAAFSIRLMSPDELRSGAWRN